MHIFYYTSQWKKNLFYFQGENQAKISSFFGVCINFLCSFVRMCLQAELIKYTKGLKTKY